MPDSCSGAQSYYMDWVSARLEQFRRPRRRWWPTCPPACTPGSILTPDSDSPTSVYYSHQFSARSDEYWAKREFSISSVLKNTYKSCVGHEEGSMAIFHPFVHTSIPLSYPLQKELGRSMKKPSRTSLYILIFTTLVWEKSYLSCFDHEEGPILHFFWVLAGGVATTYLLAKELCKSTE